jgi:nicotinate-nucleotide pyrophosphorylase (carboxylating)
MTRRGSEDAAVRHELAAARQKPAATRQSARGARAARPPRHPHRLLYEDLLRRALLEDLGGAGDLTTDAIVADEARAGACFVARRGGRIAGLRVALDTLRLLDPALVAGVTCGDGADVESGAVLARVEGAARALLTAERVALNLLGHLSGIATATRDLARAIAPHPARIADTRKTTPGLRLLEKYAVRVGGGANHRFGLDDAILIKDNHVAIAGGVRPAIERARAAAGHTVKIEVEVDSLEQLEQALSLGADCVLLDNFSTGELAEAVRRTAGRAVLEASGGITAATAAAIAATGVDLLSVGWLTHSAPALDVALDFESGARRRVP